ncbi:Rieske (2Fe-2S) protein [Aestuariimicrobium ganziense]|uniref:Rieske (2Fe-2S) protein n=1 Tax=Aestuariimicrobium ganziense TaxID=2773677 RepID=UPI001940FF77|nr:non-heme iron oxygenase ferredoxin subunit [Aestuariimicrobium ganziense]
MTFQAVATIDEIVDDLPLGVEATAPDGTEWQIVLVRFDGELYALHDECSHGHVRLSEGDLTAEGIECHLHGSLFDPRTGAALNLPATQPVATYPVKVDGTNVLVDVDHPLNNVTYEN